MQDSLQYSLSGRLAYLQAISALWNPSPLAGLASATEAMRALIVSAGEDDLEDDQHGQFATALFWPSFLKWEDKEVIAVCDALTG